ncbi:MAG: hypothetical protein OEW08_05840 [Gammaproteobacteria bacterium]|nr:hypothetical protein [Gammaproteobacteria bacterium]
MRYRQQRRIGQKPSAIVVLAVLVCLGIAATMRVTNAHPDVATSPEVQASLVSVIKSTMDHAR